MAEVIFHSQVLGITMYIFKVVTNTSKNGHNMISRSYHYDFSLSLRQTKKMGGRDGEREKY